MQAKAISDATYADHHAHVSGTIAKRGEYRECYPLSRAMKNFIRTHPDYTVVTTQEPRLIGGLPQKVRGKLVGWGQAATDPGSYKVVRADQG